MPFGVAHVVLTPGQVVVALYVRIVSTPIAQLPLRSADGLRSRDRGPMPEAKGRRWPSDLGFSPSARLTRQKKVRDFLAKGKTIPVH
ncbi:hypothetical protein DFH94DRAFT_775623, partial [Russula ochroleuca]